MLEALTLLVLVALPMAGVVLWLRRSPKHSRDVRIVDMRNRGLTAHQIADALGTTENAIREDLKRLSIGLGTTSSG